MKRTVPSIIGVAAAAVMGFAIPAAAHDAQEHRRSGDQGSLEIQVGEVRDTAEVQVGEPRALRDSGPPVELGGSDARFSDVELSQRVHANGRISGMIANRSEATVRDIQLLVEHSWMWSDEFHPGETGPGRARYVTVPGPLPPGKSVEFHYEPLPPLPHRGDGRFTTEAEIVGFDRITYEKVPRGGVGDQSGLK